MAGRLMGNGSAQSSTLASPLARRRTIERRVGSDSAANTTSNRSGAVTAAIVARFRADTSRISYLKQQLKAVTHCPRCMLSSLVMVNRIFSVSVASVYPHYVTKVEKKGRTKDELDQVIRWLTGFDETELTRHLEEGTTFEDFFAAARLNPNASLITGSVCGVRVQDVEDPLMQKIRYLYKLACGLAKGKPMGKVLRGESERTGAS